MAEPTTVQLPSRLAGKARTSTPTTGYARGQSIPRDDRTNPNVSIQSLRNPAKAATMLRALFEADGTVSTAIAQFVGMAATKLRFDAFMTGTNEYSREGKLAVETVVSGLDTLWNYRQGYQDKAGLDQLVETMLLEVVLTGAVCGELVMDSQRLPQYLTVVPYESLSWKSNGRGGKYPYQIGTQGEIDLNIPNFFVAEAFKSADRLYTLPLMTSGLKRLIAYESFIEDMSRVVRQAGAPRLLVQLNYDRVRASATPKTQSDPEALSAYMTTVRQEMQDILSGLEPEDALVFYDLAEVTSVSVDGEKRDYKELLNELSGLAASAIKSNPSALGLRMGGSQNVASTEAMLTTKLAATFQRPVQSVLSRALTLAVRLYGVDAYIKTTFEPIDLRPEHELEAHKAIQQARVLELLSLGRLTDDEAQSLLGLPSLPEGAEQLSGTGFYKTKTPDTLPVSGTNARNQAIAPDGPESAGGKDNEQRV